MRWRPWCLDITPDDAGNPPFFFDAITDPYAGPSALEWQTDDWDPALRFWALPFDANLGEWLRSVDPGKPSIMAAREFAGQIERWGKDTAFLEHATDGWLEKEDLDWRPGTSFTGTPGAAAAYQFIRSEIELLQQLMQDDRDRYLAEIDGQADGLADYVIAFLGLSQERYPWTIELINCGLAMGNVAYMRWKSLYRRVRPSYLCPGLVPPFGPPGHPSFPSGHSTLGHLIPLLLLEIPDLQRRHGKFATSATVGTAVSTTDLAGRNAIPSPLLWLGERLAKNRERLGVHYPSDSSGGRHLATAMWHALLHETDPKKKITCPSLEKVLARAKAEWPA